MDGAPLIVRRCEECTGGGAAGALAADGTLACGDGAVRLLEVQAPGGRAMAFADWARGARFAGGHATSAAPEG